MVDWTRDWIYIEIDPSWIEPVEPRIEWWIELEIEPGIESWIELYIELTEPGIELYIELRIMYKMNIWATVRIY
jgi:hypothetical protein